MNIVTWNVNSLNIRLPHVLDYLAREKPDILALQETKLPDERFPLEEIEAAGYQARISGQKTYNGVAVISKAAATELVTELPGLDDPQKRLLAATINGVRIIDVYIPNGQEVGSEKYDYKFRWLHAFKSFLQAELKQHERLVVLGDFNIAPADIDVHDAKRWRGKIMCSEAERSFFGELLGLGLHDCIRELRPDAGMFSWWDYRLNAFGRGWGLRIDHILASEGMRKVSGGVALDYRASERPSDHAPVWVDLQ